MSSRRLLPALLLLVAACSHREERPAPPAPARAATAETCRIGPDGGPPVRLVSDDRGIGGTGQLASAEDGDRGIGGTGIGNTGIVGVVTGFASICVGGLHVVYEPGLPVTFGEVTAAPEALRVGQVVVISADERHGALQARRVAVRYEVSGPVEAVEPGALRVAGQRVTLAGAVPGGTGWKVGDAVMVSGLRAPDGSIAASRIDPRPAGAPRTATVYGELRQRDGVLRVGGLPIRIEAGLQLPDPGPVIATGMIENGMLVPIAVVPDMLLRDPTYWFGPDHGRFLFEGYVSLGAGMVMLSPALHAPAPAGLAPFRARRGMVELRPGPGGGLTAEGLRDPGGAPMTGGRGELAPMPDRSFDRRQGGEAGGRGFDAAQGSRAGDRFRRSRPGSEDSPQSGAFQGSSPQGSGPQSIGQQGGGFFRGPR